MTLPNDNATAGAPSRGVPVSLAVTAGFRTLPTAGLGRHAAFEAYARSTRVCNRGHADNVLLSEVMEDALSDRGSRPLLASGLGMAAKNATVLLDRSQRSIGFAARASVSSSLPITFGSNGDRRSFHCAEQGQELSEQRNETASLRTSCRP